MTQRCYNPKAKGYKDYGGRGIRVSSEWYDEELNIVRIEPFMKWAIAKGYDRGLQIDRIDNNGNYEPSNCRFVTPMENGRNKRSCKPITYKGETLCASEWAERVGVPKYIIKERISKGKSIDEVMSPVVKKKDMQVWFRGHKVWLSHLSKRFGVSRTIIRNRIKYGWPVEIAVTKKASIGNTHLVTFAGETNSIKYFAKKFGIRYVKLCEFIRAGLSSEEAIRKLKE